MKRKYQTPYLKSNVRGAAGNQALGTVMIVPLITPTIAPNPTITPNILIAPYVTAIVS